MVRAGAALMLLAGCGDDARIATVAPAPGITWEVGPGSCHRFTDVDAPHTTRCDHLHGFTFRWGVEATVMYHLEDEDFVDDGSTIRYVVDEVLDERPDPAGTFYALDFWWNDLGEPLFTRDGPDRVQLWSQPVACEPAMCDALLATPTPYALDVELTGAAIPIRAAALRPR
jgi:hypothetical protein